MNLHISLILLPERNVNVWLGGAAKNTPTHITYNADDLTGYRPVGAVFLQPSLKELASFSLLILILLFRPAGLFGNGRDG